MFRMFRKKSMPEEIEMNVIKPQLDLKEIKFTFPSIAIDPIIFKPIIFEPIIKHKIHFDFLSTINELNKTPKKIVCSNHILTNQRAYPAHFEQAQEVYNDNPPGKGFVIR